MEEVKNKAAQSNAVKNKEAKTPRIIPAKELVFLDGPKSRGYEFGFAISVFRQFIKAFRVMHFVGPCITVFGSARFKEDHPYYIASREFGKRIAQLGFTTVTGGGPGVMEAANRGAFENEGMSVGCNIILAHEQKENPYLHKSVTFEHFFVRKTILIKYSYAFIIMPGGFGTMDEFFETLTLVQTAMIEDFPIVLYGKEFYKNLMDTIDDMVVAKTVSPDDLKLVLVTDNIDEAIEHISSYITTNYSIKSRKKKWWLLEKL